MENFFQVKLLGAKPVVSGDLQITLGKKSPQDEGIFITWNWDGEKLTLTNDRYGFYPIYYAYTKNSFAISPSITKLSELSSKPVFDEDAFSVFLRLGWLIGEDTVFNSIRALPPASTLVWEKGKLEITTKGIIKFKTQDFSRQEAIEIYADFFQKAVEKTLPTDEKFVLPISGGRDSRHILLALNKAKVKPDICLTIIHPPPRPNEDAEIAKQLCEALEVEHQLIEQTSSRFANEYKKNEITGYATDEHGWFMPLAQFIKNHQTVIYDGIAGDVLSAGLFLDKERLSLFQKGKVEDLADKLLQPEGFLPALLTRDNYKRFNRERAVNHLAKELVRHAEQPNPVGSFFFWNRTRRCIALAPFQLFNNSVNVIAPYLETKLFDFLFSLPAEMLLDHQFHTDTIAWAYPEYAHIPYEKKDSPPISDAEHFRVFSRDILRYSLSGRKGKLTNRLFFLTRCLRCILDKNYSRTVTEFGEQAILLSQLERL